MEDIDFHEEVDGCFKRVMWYIKMKYHVIKRIITDKIKVMPSVVKDNDK